MANDQGFDCQQCGAHFDSRDQLERHNKQQHTQQAGSPNRVSTRSSSNIGTSRNSGLDRDRDLNS